MMKVISETSRDEIDPAIAAWKAWAELRLERERLLNEKEFMELTEGGAAAERFDQNSIQPLERRLYAAQREFLDAPATTARGVLLKVEHLMALTEDWALERSHLRGVQQDLMRFVHKAEGRL